MAALAPVSIVPASVEPTRAVTVDLKGRARVLRKLGIREKQLTSTARITPIFEQSYGGLQKVIAALRFSEDPVIEEFLEKYDSFKPGEHEKVPFEAFVVACGINVEQFLALALSQLRIYSVKEVTAKAFAAHPEVMQATIDSAKMLGREGFQDRQLLHQGLGFSPQPKGTTFIGNVNVGQAPELPDGNDHGEIEAKQIAQPADEIDLDFIFPSLSDTQKNMGLGSLKRLTQGDQSEVDELLELERRINGN